MTKVIIGMDSRVLDVGNTYSYLKDHIWKWLDEKYPQQWQIGCGKDGYFITVPSQEAAAEFTLTWL